MVPDRVHLVEHDERIGAVDADRLQHLFDGGDLAERILVAGVHDMQQQIGVPRLFERRLERGHEVVGQVADESDGVAQQDVSPMGDLPLAGPGVERGEQLVGDVDVGAARFEKVVKGAGGYDESGRYGKTRGCHAAQAGAFAPGDGRGLRRQVAKGDDRISRGFQQDRMLR